MRYIATSLLTAFSVLAAPAVSAQLCKIADGVLPTGVTIASSVGSDGSQFVLAGDDQGYHTSTDGVNWTLQTNMSGIRSTYDMKWTGLEFLGMAGRAIFVSPDGITWERQTPNDAFNVVGAAWDGAQTIVVGNFNMGENMSARPDGGDWAPVDYGFTGSMGELIWTGDLFVSGIQGGGVLISSDGLNWTLQDVDGATPNDLAFDGTMIMAMANGRPYVSTDAITWVEVTHPGISVSELIWDGQFIAGGIDFGRDEAAVAVSDDGVVWTVGYTGVAESQIIEIATNETTILAVTQRRFQNGPPNQLIELGSSCAEAPIFADGFDG